ncbi:arylesterase [Litoribacillus peritrichatus]|uniref:Arylesterase n=1 Tax=Litoribacillus peritrichatus TaxID=718191 RepID=A0ABP7NDA9_9GAMM
MKKMQKNVWVLVLFQAFFFISSQSVAQSLSEAKTSILIVGDSLSAGYGIKVEQTWPSLLQNHFDQLGKNIKVHNASISGQTSAEGAAQILKLLQLTEPDLVVLELGANDGLRGLSVAEMKKNLADIIQSSQKAGAKVLLLGMHVPQNYGKRYSRMFHSAFQQLAEEHKTGLVPFMLETVATQPKLIQPDGLHPTAEAQPIILEYLLSRIESSAE